MSNKLKKMLVSVVMIAGGAVFLALGFMSVKQINHYPQTAAVVSHIQKDYVPDSDGYDREEIKIFVTYEVDGKEYTEELQNTKTNLKQGDNITVYYNPDNPEEVSGATKTMAAIQLGIGAALALAGLGTLVLAIIRGY